MPEQLASHVSAYKTKILRRVTLDSRGECTNRSRSCIVDIGHPSGHNSILLSNMHPDLRAAVALNNMGATLLRRGMFRQAQCAFKAATKLAQDIMENRSTEYTGHALKRTTQQLAASIKDLPVQLAFQPIIIDAEIDIEYDCHEEYCCGVILYNLGVAVMHSQNARSAKILFQLAFETLPFSLTDPLAQPQWLFAVKRVVVAIVTVTSPCDNHDSTFPPILERVQAAEAALSPYQLADTPLTVAAAA